LFYSSLDELSDEIHNYCLYRADKNVRLAQIIPGYFIFNPQTFLFKVGPLAQKNDVH